MLARITLALAGVAAVSAQSLADIQARLPICSLQCLLTSATEFNCRIDDIACQCENAAGIEESVTPCLLEAGCTMEELESKPNPHPTPLYSPMQDVLDVLTSVPC